MGVQRLSNAANKGVFLPFVVCGLVSTQMTYYAVNQLQLRSIQLQPGLEKLKPRGKVKKSESSCYVM
jgi:competence protein ComGC